MKTGVFFNDIFAKHSWPVMGYKFKNFPECMKEELRHEKVQFFKSEPVSEDLLAEVHTRRFLEDVKTQWYYEGASISVGGCVKAAELIMEGVLKNALVFNVAAGHHAGRDSAWGGTYISCTGPTIKNLRNKNLANRFAILDTDSHHGDGTRSLFLGDRDVLHVCFCGSDREEDEGTKIDVDVGWETTDAEYLEKVKDKFIPVFKKFQPSLLIHILGHDTCIGDYGNRGLTKEFFLELVKLLKGSAEELKSCAGRYLIITMGGARSDIAEYIFPRIIRILRE
ncbi:MAG: arginase family protein [Candidatus Methanospirareceae archaeon]